MKFRILSLGSSLSLALLGFTPGVWAQAPAALTSLYSFSGLGSEDTNPTLANSDGAYPQTGLVQDGNGNLYGTVTGGGASGDGTVFMVTPDGHLTTLHSFGAAKGDGQFPYAGLIDGGDGSFYGTTYSDTVVVGSANYGGTIFKVTGGSVSTLYLFKVVDGAGKNADGANPYGGLVRGSDGNLYGTAQNGGTSGTGTVFKLTPAGALTTLHSFGSGEGANPLAALVEGSDGNFYGTTSKGGTTGHGTVFRITPAGVLTTLHSFSALGGANGVTNSDGVRPVAGLAAGNDGDFYGTAYMGGAAGHGTVFKITPGGSLTTLHSFSAINTTTDANSDGVNPFGGMIRATDGNFYGTAAGGGVNGAYGTVFKITPGGAFTTLHSFSATDSNRENSDGAMPSANLVEASNGDFYGTTEEGGASGTGTVFVLIVPPTITSPTSATAHVNAPFTYQIKALGNPGTFAATTLPVDLTLDPETGIISGTPRTVGTYAVTVSASNSLGQGSAKLTLTVEPPPPVVTSATTASATEGVAFSYQITATNSPTSYGVLGLFRGITVNQKTGLISGTPTAAGKHMLTLKATNSAGTGTETLTLTIIPAGPPAITSAKTATAQTGKAFSYQIEATNNPTSYGVLGLPSGITVDQKTGLVSGTPAGPGTHTLTLKATNGIGTGTQTLTLTIDPAVPVITSPKTASATVGKAFSYQIAASHDPTSYGVGGLFKGITVDQKTGLISGTPTTTGTHSLDLRATNAGGTGHETLTLTIKAD